MLFGRNKPGQSLAYGRGVTGTKLAVLRERDDHFARLEGEQLVMKNSNGTNDESFTGLSEESICPVHHLRLGPHAMRVWVDVIKKPGSYLWRPNAEMSTIDEAKGFVVAWPAKKVIMS
ncbi:hypothetical protein UlMin_041526 [Ulmus minor]